MNAAVCELTARHEDKRQERDGERERAKEGKTAKKQLRRSERALSRVFQPEPGYRMMACGRDDNNPLHRSFLYKMDLVRVTCPRQQSAALHILHQRKKKKRKRKAADHLEAVSEFTFMQGLKSSLQVEMLLSSTCPLFGKWGKQHCFSLTAVHFFF